MQYRALGTTEIQTSAIGFGAWAVGGWMWGGTEEKAAVDALHAALDAGINLVDTAPMYGFGRSEEIVGKAMKGKRDRFVLATKCGLRWDTTDWPAGKGVLHFYSDDASIVKENPEAYRVYKYLRPESIREEVELSLRRLGTDYIDLLQTHWQDPTTPIEDYVGELHRLKEAGKIRAIGCSNVTPEQLRDYRKVGPLDADQEKLSLLDRDVFQNGLMDACREGGVSFLAYSPLANGLLTGKMSPDRVFPPGDLRGFRERFRPENIRRVNGQLERLRPIADAYGLTLGQLAIAWVAAKYDKMHVLCGIRTPTQAVENARAGAARLREGDVAEIERCCES